MSEEVFSRKDADELTRRIADRLGERQQKIDRMAEWESAEQRAGGLTVSLRPILAVLAVAACLVVALVVIAPWRSTVSPLDELGIGAPTFEEFRAPVPELSEITGLIESKNYADALPKVEAALEHSDRELRGLEMALLDTDDEILAYAEETEQMMNGELRWAYIYLLVREERNEDALSELKRYLKLPARVCTHRDEAKALQKAIKKKI